ILTLTMCLAVAASGGQSATTPKKQAALPKPPNPQAHTQGMHLPMLGMNSNDISALATVAQAILALAALIGSIAMAAFVWNGTRRIAKLDYERSVREIWIAIDTVALSSDATLIMADNLMDQRNRSDEIEQRRRRWFSYMILNAITSSFFGAKNG